MFTQPLLASPAVTTMTIPGFVDAHCHAFQRALRGRAGAGDFWAWRDRMIALAESLSVDEIRSEYAHVYRALAAAAAAEETGLAFVCLYAAYGRGGSARFRQESPAAYLRELERLRDDGIRVGVAPHSVRACPEDWLRELGRYADEHELPLHVHADEQPREIEECLAEHGVRPIELLARTGCLTQRTTVVHATHADGGELDLLADACARICVCPTTEADLGDGFVPVARICHRSLPMCIGSDSNVRIDPLEELRELEGIARRQTGKRRVVSLDSLLAFGSDEGAAALALEEWPDACVDLEHPSLRGVPEDGLYEALVFSCAGDVLRKTPLQ
jgi:formimidoylglutamate deiminase